MTSTSLIGAYLTVRGISAYAGGYPNEFTLYIGLTKEFYDF
jgi:hypothetical protein